MHLPQSSRAGWSAQAKSPVVMRCTVGSRNFVPRPVAVGTADGEKDHEGSAPSNSAAGESHLHLGKQVCRLYKNILVQVLCICRSPAVQAGRRRRNPPPERFNPLSGENLIHQVRELRRNPLWSYAVPVGSRNFVPRPLAVEPPTGEKEHEGSAPSNSAAVESHLHLGKQVCRLYKIFWCRCFASAAILRRNAGRVIHEIFPSEQEKTEGGKIATVDGSQSDH